MKCQSCGIELTEIGDRFCSPQCRTRYKQNISSTLYYIKYDDSLIEIHDLVQELLKKEAEAEEEADAPEEKVDG